MATDTWPKVRVGLGVLFGLGAAVYLIPPPPPDAKMPGRIPVVFWHGFAGEWQPIYEGMVQRFNASQSKYEVIPVSVPDADLPMKFLLSASGGATPDIFLDWDPVLGLWSDKGLVQPYDNVMTPAERQEFTKITYPIVKRHSMYRGKIMALIDGLDLYAVYYRLDHLKEIGVDQNHLPKSLDEIVALGKRLDRFDKNGRLSRAGFLPTGVINYSPVFGGHFNKDGQITVNTPENLAAMKFIRERTASYGFDAVTRFKASMAADVGPTMAQIAGNYSIMFDGEWRVKQIAQYKPDLPYFLAPMPAVKGGKGGASISAPNYLFIPTAAKEPKGAWEFAKYCVGFLHPEEGGRHMGEMGWLPDDPEVAKSKSYQAYLRKYPKYKVFVDLMTSENVELPPRGPLQAFATDQLNKAEDEVVRGAQTPEESLRTVEKNIADEKKRLRDLGEPVQ